MRATAPWWVYSLLGLLCLVSAALFFARAATGGPVTRSLIIGGLWLLVAVSLLLSARHVRSRK